MLRLGEFHRVARKAAQPLTWRRAANHNTTYFSPESPISIPVFSKIVDKLAAFLLGPQERGPPALDRQRQVSRSCYSENRTRQRSGAITESW